MLSYIHKVLHSILFMWQEYFKPINLCVDTTFFLTHPRCNNILFGIHMDVCIISFFTSCKQLLWTLNTRSVFSCICWGVCLITSDGGVLSPLRQSLKQSVYQTLTPLVRIQKVLCRFWLCWRLLFTLAASWTFNRCQTMTINPHCVHKEFRISASEICDLEMTQKSLIDKCRMTSGFIKFCS